MAQCKQRSIKVGFLTYLKPQAQEIKVSHPKAQGKHCGKEENDRWMPRKSVTFCGSIASPSYMARKSYESYSGTFDTAITWCLWHDSQEQDLWVAHGGWLRVLKETTAGPPLTLPSYLKLLKMCQHLQDLLRFSAAGEIFTAVQKKLFSALRDHSLNHERVRG